MRPAPRLNRRFGLWVQEMTAGEKGPGKQTKGRDTRWKKRAKTAAHRISLLNAPPSEGACRGRQRLLKLSRLLTRSGKAYGFRVNSFNGPILSCAPDQAAWNSQPRRLSPVWKPRQASAETRLPRKFSSGPHSNRRSILLPPEPTAVTRGHPWPAAITAVSPPFMHTRKTGMSHTPVSTRRSAPEQAVSATASQVCRPSRSPGPPPAPACGGERLPTHSLICASPGPGHHSLTSRSPAPPARAERAETGRNPPSAAGPIGWPRS